MKIFGEIKKVLLERIAGDPSNVSEARFWYDFGTKRFRFRDDSLSRSIVSDDGVETIRNKTFTTGNTIVNPDAIEAHKDIRANLDTKASIDGFTKGEIVYDETNDKFFGIRTSGIGQKLSEISEATPVIRRTQGNMFNVLDAIYHNGASWELARANSEYTTAEYVVTEATALGFVAAKFGEFTVAGHSKTIGEHYFLSDNSAGGAELTSPNKFSCPIFYVEDADTIHIEVYRPIEIGEAGSGSGSGSGPVSSKDTILNNVPSTPTTILIDSANAFSTIVEYTVNRGTAVEYGRLFLLTDTNQAFTLTVVEKIGNVGITFDLLEVADIGTLRYTTTDTQSGEIRFTVQSYEV